MHSHAKKKSKKNEKILGPGFESPSKKKVKLGNRLKPGNRPNLSLGRTLKRAFPRLKSVPKLKFEKKKS